MSVQFWLAFAAVAALGAAFAFNLIRAVMRDSGRCVHCDRLYPLGALPTHEDNCAGDQHGR